MSALIHKTLVGLAVAAAACGSSTAAPDRSTLPAAADPQARVAPLSYRPALASYQAWPADPAPVTDWRAANRRVHEAGGWRAYLREAQSATPSAAPASAPAARDAAAHRH